MRDLVSMAFAVTEPCRVWPKTSAQDVKCVREHCHGAGSSRHPAIFRSFSANWFTQTSRHLHVQFLVNCLPVGSVLVVYDTLRIKKPPVKWPLFFFARGAPSGRGDVGPFHCDDCCFVSVFSPYACCNNSYVSVAVFLILKQNLMQIRYSVLSHIVKVAMT